jgi:DNA-binding CsgD family transcriptional regulator
MMSSQSPANEPTQRLAGSVPSAATLFRIGRTASNFPAQFLVDVCDALDFGIIFLSGDRRVAQMNIVAQSHIGNGLTLVNHRLRALKRADDEPLQELIEGALTGALTDAVLARTVVSRPGQLPLIVHVIPFVTQEGRPQCALLSFDLAHERSPSEPILRQVFGLTPREASLAVAVHQGLNAGEIAERYHITEGTVRTHIKSLMAKTSTRRQVELVALLSRFSMA